MHLRWVGLRREKNVRLVVLVSCLSADENRLNSWFDMSGGAVFHIHKSEAETRALVYHLRFAWQKEISFFSGKELGRS